MRNEKWEWKRKMRNENGNKKWEIRIELWINKKRFYWFVKLIYKKWIITGFLGKKSCKRQFFKLICQTNI